MNRRENSRATRWAAFLAGCLGIWLFIFVLAPWLQKWGLVHTMHTFIQERDIDATPLFYSESEVSSEAERLLLDAARFAPRGPGRSIKPRAAQGGSRARLRGACPRKRSR